LDKSLLSAIVRLRLAHEQFEQPYLSVRQLCQEQLCQDKHTSTPDLTGPGRKVTCWLEINCNHKDCECYRQNNRTIQGSTDYFNVLFIKGLHIRETIITPGTSGVSQYDTVETPVMKEKLRSSSVNA